MNVSKRIGFILLGAAAFAAFSEGVMAGGGYLVRVGPTPLRFASAAPHLGPALLLPPLKMSDEPVTNSTEHADSDLPKELEPDLLPDDAVVPSGALFGPELPPPADAPVAEANPVSAPPRGEVTPQMLLRFFTPDRTKRAVLPAPLEFTPPAPPVSSGSSASYISR